MVKVINVNIYNVTVTFKNNEKEVLSHILERHSAPISKTTNGVLPDIQSNWKIASDVEKVGLYFVGLEATCDKKRLANLQAQCKEVTWSILTSNFKRIRQNLN